MEYIINHKTSDNIKHTIFDIEVYIEEYNSSTISSLSIHGWITNIVVSPKISGAIHFLRDKIVEDDFNIHQFENDCREIENIKWIILMEYPNHPRDFSKAVNDRIKWGKEVKNTLTEFCEKYGLELMEM